MAETAEVGHLKSLPPDIPPVWYPGGKLKGGSGYVYDSSDLKGEEIELEGNTERPLSPFRYNKPIPNPKNPNDQPMEFVLDENPREGVYPLKIVRSKRRPPNHMYQAEDAIVAAVKTGEGEVQTYETKYFPKSCIPPETWKEATQILGEEE